MYDMIMCRGGINKTELLVDRDIIIKGWVATIVQQLIVMLIGMNS